MREHADFEACVAFQEEIWGEGFSERVPVAILKIASRLGGVVAAAWEPDGRTAGFVFGLTGVRDGELVHWSDMLAVRAELRGRGLGRRLKAYQRERLLERGVRTTLWTFDPLESRNAYLNLGKLGVVVREYLENMYGESGSPLHRGVGTDRFLACWEMASERAEARLAGRVDLPCWEDVEGLPVAFDVEDGDDPARVTPRVSVQSAEEAPSWRSRVPDAPSGAGLLVPIPADLRAVQAASLERAAAWREATRPVLAAALSRGWEVRELVRTPDRGISCYVLVRGKAPDIEAGGPEASGVDARGSERSGGPSGTAGEGA